jgi:hypothetical protein
MTVLQFDFEHRVAEGFRDDAVLFDQCLFRHAFWVRKDSDSIRS